MDETIYDAGSYLNITRQDVDSLITTKEGVESLYNKMREADLLPSGVTVEQFSDKYSAKAKAQPKTSSATPESVNEMYNLLSQGLGMDINEITAKIKANPNSLLEYKSEMENKGFLEKGEVSDSLWAEKFGFSMSEQTPASKTTTKTNSAYRVDDNGMYTDKETGVKFKDYADLSNQVSNKQEKADRAKTEDKVFSQAPTLFGQTTGAASEGTSFSEAEQKELDSLKLTLDRADKNGIPKPDNAISADRNLFVNFETRETLANPSMFEYNKKKSRLESEIKELTGRVGGEKSQNRLNTVGTPLTDTEQKDLKTKKKELEEHKNLNSAYVIANATMNVDEYIQTDRELTGRFIATGADARAAYEQVSTVVNSHKSIQSEAIEELDSRLQTEHTQKGMIDYYTSSDQLNKKSEAGKLTQEDLDEHKRKFDLIIKDPKLQQLNEIYRQSGKTVNKESELLLELQDTDLEAYKDVTDIEDAILSRDTNGKGMLNASWDFVVRGLSRGLNSTLQTAANTTNFTVPGVSTSSDLLGRLAREAKDMGDFRPTSSRAQAGITQSAPFDYLGKSYKAIYEDGKVIDVRDEQDYSVATEVLLKNAALFTSEKEAKRDISWYSLANSTADVILDIAIDVAITKGTGMAMGGTKTAYSIGQSLSAYSRGYTGTYNELIDTPGMSTTGAHIGAGVMGIAAAGLTKINPMESRIAQNGLDDFLSSYSRKNVVRLASGKITAKDVVADYAAWIAKAGISGGKETLEEVPEDLIKSYALNPVLNKVYGTKLTEGVSANDVIETAIVSFGAGILGAGIPNTPRGIRNKALEIVAGNTSTFIDFAEGLAESNPDMAANLSTYISTAKELEVLAPNVKDEKVRVEIMKDMLKVRDMKDGLAKMTISTAVDARKEQIKTKENAIVSKIEKFSEATIKKVDQLENKKVGSDTRLRAYDFDGTLFTDGKLTTIGREVKKRIEAGEDIKVVTAREATNTQEIKDALGIKDSSITATGDESLKLAELQKMGINTDEYYDSDKTKLDNIRNGITNPEQDVTTPIPALSDVESTAKALEGTDEKSINAVSKSFGFPKKFYHSESEDGGYHQSLTNDVMVNSRNADTELTFYLKGVEPDTKRGGKGSHALESPQGEAIYFHEVGHKMFSKFSELGHEILNKLKAYNKTDDFGHPTAYSAITEDLFDATMMDFYSFYKLHPKELKSSQPKAYDLMKEWEQKYISEAYHSDKATGKETELTKAVESLFVQPTEDSTPSGIEQDKGEQSIPEQVQTNTLENFQPLNTKGKPLSPNTQRVYEKSAEGKWFFRTRDKDGNLGKPTTVTQQGIKTQLDGELEKVNNQTNITNEKESSKKDGDKSQTEEGEVDPTLAQEEEVTPLQTVLQEIGKTEAEIVEQIYKFFTSRIPNLSEIQAREFAQVNYNMWNAVATTLGKESKQKGIDYIRSKVAQIGSIATVEEATGMSGDVKFDNQSLDTSKVVVNNAIKYLQKSVKAQVSDLNGESNKEKIAKLRDSIKNNREALKRLQESLKDPKFSMATHATPNDFKHFDDSKLTGGVRSVYGWGHYFSSSAYKAGQYGTIQKLINTEDFNLIPSNTIVDELLYEKLRQSDNSYILLQLEKERIQIDAVLDTVKNNQEFDAFSKLLEENEKQRLDYTNKPNNKDILDIIKANIGKELDVIRLIVENSPAMGRKNTSDTSGNSTNKLFSEVLLSAGFDGVTVADGYEIVVFNTPKLNTKFSKEGARYRGAAITLANGATIVAALNSPSPTTLAHEGIFHSIIEGAMTPEEQQGFIEEYNEKAGEKETNWSTDVSEFAARIYETYLSNGRKLTSKEVKDTGRRKTLQEAFDKFTELVKEFYKNGIKYINSKGKEVKIELTPQAQAFFDRVTGIKTQPTKTEPSSESGVETGSEESVSDATDKLAEKRKELNEALRAFFIGGNIGVIFDPQQEAEKMSESQRMLVGALIGYIKALGNVTVASLKAFFKSEDFKDIYRNVTDETLEISDEGLKFLIDKARTEPDEEDTKGNTQQFRKRIIGRLTGIEMATDNLTDNEFYELVDAYYELIVEDVESGSIDLTKMLEELLGSINLLATTKSKSMGQGWQLGVVAKLAEYYKENRDQKNFDTASNYLSAVASNLGGIFRLLNTRVMGKYLHIVRAIDIGQKYLESFDKEVSDGVSARDLAKKIKGDIGLSIEDILAKLPPERLSEFVKKGIKDIKSSERYKEAIAKIVGKVKFQANNNPDFEVYKGLATYSLEQAKGNYTLAKALFRGIMTGVVSNPAEVWSSVIQDPDFMLEQRDVLQKEIDRRVKQRLATKPTPTTDPLAMFVDAIMNSKPKTKSVSLKDITKAEVKRAIDEVAVLYTDPLKRAQVRAALEDRLGAIIVGGVGKSNVRKKIRDNKDIIKEVMESRASRDFLDQTITEELIAEHGVDIDDAVYFAKEIQKIISAHIDSLTEKQKQKIFLSTLGIDAELISDTIKKIEKELLTETDTTKIKGLENSLKTAQKALAEISQNTKRHINKKRSIDNLFKILRSGELSDQDIMSAFAEKYNLVSLSTSDISKMLVLIDTINGSKKPVEVNNAIRALTILIRDNSNNLATVTFFKSNIYSGILSGINSFATALRSATNGLIMEIGRDAMFAFSKAAINFITGKGFSSDNLKLVTFALKWALRTAWPITKANVKLLYVGGVISPDQKFEDFKAQSEMIDPVFAKMVVRINKKFGGVLPSQLLQAIAKAAASFQLTVIILGKSVAVADALVAPLIYNYTGIKESALKEIAEDELLGGYGGVITALNQKFMDRAKELEIIFKSPDPNTGEPGTDVWDNVMLSLHQERLKSTEQVILAAAQTTADLHALTGAYRGMFAPLMQTVQRLDSYLTNQSIAYGKKIPERQSLDSPTDLLYGDYYAALGRNLLSSDRLLSIGYGTASTISTLAIAFPRLISATAGLGKNFTPLIFFGPRLKDQADGSLKVGYGYNMSHSVIINSMGEYEKRDYTATQVATKWILATMVGSVYGLIEVLFKRVPCEDPEEGKDCYEPADKTFRFVGAGSKFKKQGAVNTVEKNSFQVLENGEWVTKWSYDNFMPVVALLAPLGYLYDKYDFGTDPNITKTPKLNVFEGKEASKEDLLPVVMNVISLMVEVLKISSTAITTTLQSGILSDLPSAVGVGAKFISGGFTSEIDNGKKEETEKDKTMFWRNTTDNLMTIFPGTPAALTQTMGAINSYVLDRPQGIVDLVKGYGAFDVIGNRFLEKNALAGMFVSKDIAYDVVGLPKTFNTNFKVVPDAFANSSYLKGGMGILPEERSFFTTDQKRYIKVLRSFNRFDEPVNRYPTGVTTRETSERGGAQVVYQGLVNYVEMAEMSNQINKRVGEYFTNNIDKVEKITNLEYNNAAKKISDISFADIEGNHILEHLLFAASKFKFTEDEEDTLMLAQGTLERGLSKFLDSRKSGNTVEENQKLIEGNINLDKEFSDFLTYNKIKHTPLGVSEILSEKGIRKKGVYLHTRQLKTSGFETGKEDPLGGETAIPIVDKGKIKKWLIDNGLRLKRGELTRVEYGDAPELVPGLPED